ncbi:DNA polymerase IV [Pedobacter psychrophilus]|uniref:DNA polymerase IV n=1 Tax=Pedobacter psychrophilus TaxID=1826909 RepID=A0A179DM85_9SPHI|nr:DNA polymerase/3'-5' exonuclease PolX [Pedobacter psychrophilus]OAQ42155.1 DNA polymerase IV [Pedobacter psychrophilus]
MENKDISKAFKLLSQLMELHQENPFKIKSIANTSFKIDKLPFKLKDKNPDELEKIDGIGKSSAAKITELLQKGEIEELNTLIAQTPEGILEMMTIKGLGPKKIEIIWNVLEIETVGELYYACNENRLIEAKGFGLKTQEEIKLAIEFKMANMGRFLYAKIEAFAHKYQNDFLQEFRKTDSAVEVIITGEFRRKCEIIDVLSFLIVSNDGDILLNQLPKVLDLIEPKLEKNEIIFHDNNGLKIHIITCKQEEKGNALFNTTGSEAHISLVKNHLKSNLLFDNEVELYQSAGMDYILPELREGYNEVDLAFKHHLPILIINEDLKGTLHNHSTWSDGVHTVEEMALYCRDEMNLEYFGICDHSKTAVYAKGLSIERVLQQQEEIDHLNKKLAPFKIFKGIESDILSDGSLDYPEEILKRFDFVVASVHSAMKMDVEKATNRLIKAIENPYTTILGHPTGRLLLSRSGYPLDFEKIIDACAANKVVIEINANPLRLDLDWRWHRYAIQKGVLLSINPDAHRTEGLLDMQYGINVARKGGLTKNDCLNASTLQEIELLFNAKKF